MTEPDEFTGSFELGPDLLARFRQAAALLKINAWTAEDETRLDEALIPLFWKRVNAGDEVAGCKVTEAETRGRELQLVCRKGKADA
jgi:chorismate mutase